MAGSSVSGLAISARDGGSYGDVQLQLSRRTI